jgi:hypothetical protein
LRNAFFAELKQRPDYVPPDPTKRIYTFLDFPEPQAFIQVCGEVIQQLHASGVIAEVCGKPTPVGITYVPHDSDGMMVEFAARVAEAANPPGLADAMIACQRHIGM